MVKYHYSANADESVFYRVLTKHFDSLWRTSSKERCTICIPPDDDVRCFYSTYGKDSSKLQSFIKSHIFKDSPYFVGQYTSLTGKVLTECETTNTQQQQQQQQQQRLLKRSSISFQSFRRLLALNGEDEDDGKPPIKSLETTQGFQNNFVVNVIGEETFYNDDFQSFTVWFVDKCILDEWPTIRQLAQKSASNQRRSMIYKREPTTEHEFHDFLKQACPDVYSSCMRHILTFNRAYLLLTGYHDQAVQRIKEYYDQLVEQYLNNEADPSNGEQYLITLKNSLMSILLSGIYDKFFPYWTKVHKAEDNLLLAQQKAVAKLSFDELEIPKAFQHRQDAAIRCLQELNNRRSSFEKIKCIKQASELILTTIEIANSEENGELSTTQQVLTSDELVPLFTYVLSQANLLHLASNATFMRVLSIDEILSNEYGYALTSFEVALEYMKKRATELGVIKAEVSSDDENTSKDEIQRPHTYRGPSQQSRKMERKEKAMSLSRPIKYNYLDGTGNSTSVPMGLIATDEPPKRKLSIRKSASSDLLDEYARSIKGSLEGSLDNEDSNGDRSSSYKNGTKYAQNQNANIPSEISSNTVPSRIVLTTSGKNRSRGLGSFVESLLNKE